MKQILGKNYYTVRETAELLQVCEASIYNFLKSGLQGTRIGGRIYFSEEAIHAFLKKR